MQLEEVLISIVIGMMLTIGAGVLAYYLSGKRKNRITTYHVKIFFAHGITKKLILNEEQYEHLETILNGVDGMFEIQDDVNHVRLYREFMCAVEVKKK